ncbi:MAG: hypothetical protein JEZ07_16155 [Phycisphaerae bacterium]|nr:hypothetical protein [Phycisphaerae bacterium]
MLYIKLLHGRADPNQDMQIKGNEGPTLGPYECIEGIYTSWIKLIKPDGSCDMLKYFGDMVLYNGVYYGQWQVFIQYKIIID